MLLYQYSVSMENKHVFTCNSQNIYYTKIFLGAYAHGQLDPLVKEYMCGNDAECTLWLAAIYIVYKVACAQLFSLFRCMHSIVPPPKVVWISAPAYIIYCPIWKSCEKGPKHASNLVTL